jgi:hypothetical protein
MAETLARRSRLALSALAAFSLVCNLAVSTRANAAEAPGSLVLAELQQPPPTAGLKPRVSLLAARKWGKNRTQRMATSADLASRAREPSLRTVPLILGISF